jgi:RNA polymerase-binding transcription factor DksA
MDGSVPETGWMHGHPAWGVRPAPTDHPEATLQTGGVASAFISLALARLERDHAALLAALCELESGAACGNAAAGARSADWPDSPVLRDALQTLLREDLRQTQRALRLAAEGTYGYCEVCHAALSLHTLMVQPATTRCAACASAADRAEQVH